MQSVRPLLVVLGLLGACTIAPWSIEVAHAQSGPAVFQGAGLIEIVPAGDVIGDGASAVTIHVLALGPDGSPLTGLRLKPAATAGTVTGWTEGAGGVYSFSYTAPKVSTPVDIELSVKGRTVTRLPINAKYNLPVRPPVATGVGVTANPPELVLGQDGEGSVSISLEGLAGDVDTDNLLVSVSAGELTNLTYLGNGRFTGRYVTPKVNFPQLAVISVMDAREPDRAYGALAVPLLGKTDYPVQAQPGAKVVLRIGGREFGPATAGNTGRVAVPVVVPPGVTSATQIEVINGQTSSKDIDLRVPETSRVAFLPMRKAVPGDGQTAVPVRVAVFGAGGEPETSAPVVFQAKGGSITTGKHVGNGIYEAMFTPRAGNDIVTAEVVATVQGAPLQKDKAELRVVPGRPQNLTVRGQPEKLLKDATALRLFAKITGPNGQGLDRRDLALSVSGASVKGEIQDLRNGDYRADLSAGGKTNVDVVAVVQSPATGNPLAHVLLFPASDVVPADGTTATRLTVVGVDEFGFPLPNLDIGVKIETGDGSVQPTVRTSEAGIGQVYYRSGTATGMVRVRVSSGNRTGVVSFLQAPVSATTNVPASGSSRELALIDSWDGLVVSLRIPREGAVEAITGPVDMAGTQHAGAVASINVRSEPSSAAAGGKINLNIQAQDSQGMGVAGVQFDVLVSQGVVGAVSDMGGGAYSASIDLPSTAAGELKVSVAHGDRATFLKIPVTGAVASGGQGWGDHTGPTTPADPIVTPPPSGVDDPSDRDWMKNRLQAGYSFGSYAYEQAPSIDGSGPLLPAIIAVGGENGDNAAAPQGVELAYEGWYNQYFGLQAGLGIAGWGLTADQFGGDVASDALVNFHFTGAARYPFEVDNNLFWVGARVGYQAGDMLYFTGDFDGEQQVNYQSLLVQGVKVGAEIGVDADKLHVRGGVDARMVGLAEFLGVSAGTEVSYDLTDDVYAIVGFGYRTREVKVIGDTSGDVLGTLSDAHLDGRIGVGVNF